MTGTVKYFDWGRGFGFIKPDSSGPDVFLHVSTLASAGIEALPNGARVKYSLIADRDGRSAASELRMI